MKKDYQIPEVELISLTARENVTSGDNVDMEGSVGSSVFD